MVLLQCVTMGTECRYVIYNLLAARFRNSRHFLVLLWRGTGEDCFDVAKHGLSANISVAFRATLNLSAYYFINHCLADLCKFFGCFFGHFGKEIFFFSKDRLN